MKTIMIGLIAMLGMLQANASDPDKTVVATYQNLTEEGYFSFKTKDGKEMIFHHIEVESEFDLYDESMNGKTFKISWTEEEWEDYDEEGNLKDQPLLAKIITSIEKA